MVTWNHLLAWICMITSWRVKFQNHLESWSHLNSCKHVYVVLPKPSIFVLDFYFSGMYKLLPVLLTHLHWWIRRLNNNKLTGSIPRELTRLTDLKILWVFFSSHVLLFFLFTFVIGLLANFKTPILQWCF